MSDSRQIEYVGFDNGVVRVVHDQPEPSDVSFKKAEEATHEYLVNNGLYALLSDNDTTKAEAPESYHRLQVSPERLARDTALLGHIAITAPVSFIANKLDEFTV